MSANALASEVLTLRRMVSSSEGENQVLRVATGTRTNNIPQDVHARHDAHKQNLRRSSLQRSAREPPQRKLEVLTKYLNATPPATNQKSTINPAIRKIRIHVLNRYKYSFFKRVLHVLTALLVLPTTGRTRRTRQGPEKRPCWRSYRTHRR